MVLSDKFYEKMPLKIGKKREIIYKKNIRNEVTNYADVRTAMYNILCLANRSNAHEF